MTSAWTVDELERIGSAEELSIATYHPDGTLHRAIPIWVIRSGDSAYVRTWYRRDTGWFGRAVDCSRARIRVPDLDITVAIDDVGDADPILRRQVDTAYRTKYDRYGPPTIDRMVTDDAAATTLRLNPDREFSATNDSLPVAQ